MKIDRISNTLRRDAMRIIDAHRLAPADKHRAHLARQRRVKRAQAWKAIDWEGIKGRIA